MATALSTIVPILQREVNAPGFELFPDALAGDYLGYVADGFWEGRLSGVFEGWTIVDGSTLTVPARGDFITNSDEDDFAETDQMFLAIIGGFRLIQRRSFDLATNFKAEAGPVSYDRQVSATALRSILASLERRLNEYRELYSNLYPATAFYYMDGVAQSSYAVLTGLAKETVIY